MLPFNPWLLTSGKERHMLEKQMDEKLARRQVLEKCGKFAAVTPPAIAVLMATGKTNYAVAASGTNNGRGPQGNNGFGNGGGDGVPGNSGFPDTNR
jgi:hypothetical protein